MYKTAYNLIFNNKNFVSTWETAVLDSLSFTW